MSGFWRWQQCNEKKNAVMWRNEQIQNRQKRTIKPITSKRQWDKRTKEKRTKFFGHQRSTLVFIVRILICFLISHSFFNLMCFFSHNYCLLNVYTPVSWHAHIHMHAHNNSNLTNVTLYTLLLNAWISPFGFYSWKENNENESTQLRDVVKSYHHLANTTKWYEWLYIYCNDRSKKLHSWKKQSNFICKTDVRTAT